VCYGAKECQIITGGTDRKIGYWECCDGKVIRELEGSKSGSINAMDVSPDQNYFVTGGDDKLLKVQIKHCFLSNISKFLLEHTKGFCEREGKLIDVQHFLRTSELALIYS
jgi:WD40 repeat protein